MRKRFSMGALALLAVVGLGLGAASPARAVPIVGDYTLVDVTSVGALSSAGVSLETLGSAEAFSSPALGVLLALFPVTGGDVDLPNSFAGTIEHQGSGLRLTFAGAPVALTDFVIDTTTLKLTATVASDVFNGVTDFFDIVPCQSGPPGTCQTIPGGAVIPSALGLRISQNGGIVLAAAWGLPGLQGLQFGVANTALVAIPEPTTALLLGAGLAGLATAGRRRRG